ncbi:Pectinesterase 2 [Platanthera guangdongensis]|uniref:Pectinesterase 2 n=1 Tax=Platanthera guangdongensis TaxID=2320717 RepID=A0ABR2MS85_9ASPA
MATLRSPPTRLIPVAILITAALLLTLLLAGGRQPPPTNHTHLHATSHLHSTVAASAAATARHCSGTLYPSLCFSSLLSIPNLSAKSLPDIITAVVNQTTSAVRSTYHNCSSISRRQPHLDSLQRYALYDCLELLESSLDQLHLAVKDLRRTSSATCHSELITILSAAITNQYTCLDGFAFVSGHIRIRHFIEAYIVHIYRLLSNVLAMSKKIPVPPANSAGEVFDGYGRMRDDGFPAWLTRTDRKLLQTKTPGGLTANLVVAKDGSGNFTTVTAAVEAAPNNSATRFVIYIKAGGYFENVEVGKNKINLMFVGDGIGQTVIKASRNVVDGWTTFRSATVG